jgi:hypothetical protein
VLIYLLQISSFLRQGTIDGVDWAVSWSGRFTPEERAPDISLIGSGWVGPKSGLNAVEKKKMDPTENQTPSPRSSSL